MKPLLSVIVPTKNRLDYVKSAIQSVLELCSKEVEVVIHDNSDSNELGEWIRNDIKSSRVVYGYDKKPLSMCENYDRAVDLSTGEYVCMIGDDDSVLPQITEVVRWAKFNKIDAIVTPSLINYIWPDLKLKGLKSMAAGHLVLRKFTCTISKVDPMKELNSILTDAAQKFHKMPKLYYGIIERSTVDSIKRLCGRYFPEPSPDMTSSVAASILSKNVFFIDYPLFVPGSSQKSNAGLSGQKRHVGRLSDQPHLKSNAESTWSEVVPKFYSVQTIWAEAAIEALKATGRNDLIVQFNKPQLYALCFVFHFKLMLKNLQCVIKQPDFIGVRKINFINKILGWYIYWWSVRGKSLIVRLLSIPDKSIEISFDGVQDINEAVAIINGYLCKNYGSPRVMLQNIKY